MPISISFKDVTLYNDSEGFSCDIEPGSSALIVTSREEESALLTRLVTGMSRPHSGSVLVNGVDLATLELPALYALRQQIGVVPSNGGLISNLKLWENITLPLMYDTGVISAEQEKSGLEYLEKLGYTGNVMALPAHLSLHERRTGALVRAFLRKPQIMLYCNCFDGAPSSCLKSFLEAAQEFHSAEPCRTSLYVSSAPDLAGDLPVDMVFRLNEPLDTVPRKI